MSHPNRFFDVVKKFGAKSPIVAFYGLLAFGGYKGYQAYQDGSMKDWLSGAGDTVDSWRNNVMEKIHNLVDSKGAEGDQAAVEAAAGKFSQSSGLMGNYLNQLPPQQRQQVLDTFNGVDPKTLKFEPTDNYVLTSKVIDAQKNGTVLNFDDPSVVVNLTSILAGTQDQYQRIYAISTQDGSNTLLVNVDPSYQYGAEALANAKDPAWYEDWFNKAKEVAGDVIEKTKELQAQFQHGLEDMGFNKGFASILSTGAMAMVGKDIVGFLTGKGGGDNVQGLKVAGITFAVLLGGKALFPGLFKKMGLLKDGPSEEDLIEARDGLIKRLKGMQEEYESGRLTLLDVHAMKNGWKEEDLSVDLGGGTKLTLQEVNKLSQQLDEQKKTYDTAIAGMNEALKVKGVTASDIATVAKEIQAALLASPVQTPPLYSQVTTTWNVGNTPVTETTFRIEQTLSWDALEAMLSDQVKNSAAYQAFRNDAADGTVDAKDALNRMMNLEALTTFVDEHYRDAKAQLGIFAERIIENATNLKGGEEFKQALWRLKANYTSHLDVASDTLPELDEKQRILAARAFDKQTGMNTEQELKVAIRKSKYNEERRVKTPEELVALVQNVENFMTGVGEDATTRITNAGHQYVKAFSDFNFDEALAGVTLPNQPNGQDITIEMPSGGFGAALNSLNPRIRDLVIAKELAEYLSELKPFYDEQIKAGLTPEQIGVPNINKLEKMFGIDIAEQTFDALSKKVEAMAMRTDEWARKKMPGEGRLDRRAATKDIDLSWATIDIDTKHFIPVDPSEIQQNSHLRPDKGQGRQ